jgi:DNA (cytosine-5)-methyltransferase 1
VKILNLYAGIGGNRTLWGDEHQVTAVEWDREIAHVYKERFSNDIVVVRDAHEYLLAALNEYDLIWSSPPCPTHGQYRYNVGVRAKGYAPLYPDMTLYQEILLLKHHHNALWVVENVVPYYTPLVEPTAQLQRHLVWSNFDIPPRAFEAKGLRTKNKISDYDHLGVDLSGRKIANKRQVLRNAVDPDLGLHILNAATAAMAERKAS